MLRECPTIELSVVFLVKILQRFAIFCPILAIKRVVNKSILTLKLELNFFRAGFPVFSAQFLVGKMKNWRMISL